jgi:hypothetical protein
MDSYGTTLPKPEKEPRRRFRSSDLAFTTSISISRGRAPASAPRSSHRVRQLLTLQSARSTKTLGTRASWARSHICLHTCRAWKASQEPFASARERRSTNRVTLRRKTERDLQDFNYVSAGASSVWSVPMKTGKGGRKIDVALTEACTALNERIRQDRVLTFVSVLLATPRVPGPQSPTPNPVFR